MSGIVERLTEGIVNRDMRAEGHALLSKWERTGLLEGLGSDRQKNSMARLLENQAKELLRESSSMGAGDVEGFAAVAFPIVRRVFAGLIANDLVSVQPMSLPSGLIFFLDFVYSGDLGGTNSAVSSKLGNVADKSIYGTDQVGSQVTGGVDLVASGDGTAPGGGSLPGPRQMVGYAYASPSGSNSAYTTSLDDVGTIAFKLDGDLTEDRMKLLDYDPDLLAKTTGAMIILDVAEDHMTNADFSNMSAFSLEDVINATTSGNDLLTMLNAITGGPVVGTIGAIGEIQQVRRLTRRVSTNSLGAPFQSGLTSQAKAVRLYLVIDDGDDVTTESDTFVAAAAALDADKLKYPVEDTATASTSAAAGAIDTFTMLLENSSNIPEIDIKVDSIAITAQTKKLKAKWTPELGQDLNAYHNLDAEVELTSILSEQIALEIDREILADLVNEAAAATYYWSRSPGLFVNRETGAEIGASSAAPDFTGTVSEWYETLVETINDVSAQVHRKTLRGGANFLVVSPEVANVLEFTAGFRASVTHDDDKGSVGSVKVGSLSKKFDVIVDPYFPRNVVLVGRRGSSFLESGYVYAPYVPLQTTPTIFGPEDFVPRKGVMTRYAKKMVRPDMYGLVIVRGLLGEAGAS
jgi:hypothetical protein